MAGRRGKAKAKDPVEVTAARPAERLLLESVLNLEGRRILCLLSTEGYTAEALASQRPEAAVCCHLLDLGMAEYLRSNLGVVLPNLEIACQSDVPARPFDLVTIPFPTWGETELGRELLEQGADALQPGGQLVAATEPGGDARLHEEMKRHFAKVTKLPYDDGVIFIARKDAPLRKRRDFTYEFAFRDNGRLIQAASRPGLHNHRRVAASLRPMLDVLDVAPNERVLNLGCDAGVIALAAAARETTAHVVAVDFHPRAIDCTLRGAALNELTNLEVHLAPGRWAEPKASFDLAVACPPYIPLERLSDIYVEGIVTALKPGGRMRLISKHTAWFVEEFSRVMKDVEVTSVRDHFQISGIKKGH